MKRPQFQSIEKKKPGVILLVDKQGVLGPYLQEAVAPAGQVVFVSAQKPRVTLQTQHVDFSRPFPTIPDYSYSHVMLVYTGEKETSDIMDQFLEKADHDKSRLVVVTDILHASPTFLEYIRQHYRQAAVVVVGDMFAKDMEFDNSVCRFITQANTTGRIEVAGDGLTPLFPVYFSDVISEICRVTFTQVPGTLFFLFPQHPPTSLSFVRTLQQINPLLHMDFVPTTTYEEEQQAHNQRQQHRYQNGTYLLASNYPLLRKLKEGKIIDDTPKKPVAFKPSGKKVTIKPVTPVKKKKKQTAWLYWVTILFMLFFLVAPFLTTLAFAAGGYVSLLKTKTALQNSDFQTAKNQALRAQTMFTLSQNTLFVSQAELSAFGRQDLIAPLSKQIALGNDASFTIITLVDAMREYEAVFFKKSPTPQQTFLEASNKVKKTLVSLQRLEAEQDIAQLKDVSNILDLVGNMIDALPQLLGFHGKTEYALFFQNNMELRPAGGFIGSYGLVSFDQGSVASFTIHDIYDADGQLKDHLEPPYPIRRHLRQVHLYLRDSNFSADLQTTASVSANLLQKETGQAVDGIITVDVSFVKILLQAIGPVRVTDYNETVTADNFYVLTQSHAEKNFTPGSSQKKDFLRSLLLAIQIKLTEQKAFPYLALAKAVVQGLQEKHIMMAFADTSMQKLAEVNGLSPTFTDDRSKDPNTVNDFLAVIEANLGVNKANAFVNRRVEQKVVVDEKGTVTEQVTVRFKNDSKDWPGGDYVNYVRFLVPYGAILNGVTIDGKKQAVVDAIIDPYLYEDPNFKPPTGLEVETATEVKKTAFGFLVVVPKGAYKTIILSYTLADGVTVSGQNVSYDLLYKKQPGTDHYVYSLSVQFPIGFILNKSSEDLLFSNGIARFDRPIVGDKQLHIDLLKQ